jgi:DNA segregation ATPase FtsK/SpoIIIE-like protein
MLFKSSENPEPIYLQGAFISPADIKQIVERITSQPHDLSNKFIIPEMDIPQPMTQAFEEIMPKMPAADSKKELADVILWALGRENISKLQIMQQFRMGNRAGNVMETLFRMNVVADKFANQPRSIIPSTVDDISAEVMEFLAANGISADKINAAISERNNQF